MKQQLIPHPDVLNRIIDQYGVLIGGNNLARLLGYPSKSALSQAIYRGTCPVRVSKIPGRHGYYATADDIAALVVKLKEGGQNNSVRGMLD